MQIALAPMEGLVDNILRDVLTHVGGIDWCVTEFIRVNDRLLTPAYFHKLAPELLHGAHTAAGVPLRVQLLGSDPACLADNAAFACELGTRGFLTGDLVADSRSLIPVDGYLPVAPMPPAPQGDRLERYAVTDPERLAWWRERLQSAISAS